MSKVINDMEQHEHRDFKYPRTLEDRPHLKRFEYRPGVLIGGRFSESKAEVLLEELKTKYPTGTGILKIVGFVISLPLTNEQRKGQYVDNRIKFPFLETE